MDSCSGYHAGEITKPRPARADEAGGFYQALNRGNLRAEILHKDEVLAAFERVLREALQLHQVQLFSYQLMPNHYHLVLSPLVDGEMSRCHGLGVWNAHDAISRSLPHQRTKQREQNKEA
jgi:putative transposase